MTRPTVPTRTPLNAGDKSREDRKTRLEAARRRVDELIKEEPEKQRLAKLKRERQVAANRRGFCS